MIATLASLFLLYCSGVLAVCMNETSARRSVHVVVEAFILWFFGLVTVGSVLSALHLFNSTTMITLPLLGGVGALGIVVWREGQAGLARHSRLLWAMVQKLGWGLLRACQKAGWPLVVVVATAVGISGYLIFAAYVSPPRGNMDMMYYHEPIIGFTFQNGGWKGVNLPGNLQRINGMPRMCHMMYLWFAAFSGRELTELPNSIGNIMGVFAVYGLLRHVGVQKSVAIGWSFCWLLAPGMMRLTSGLMVDPMSGSFVAAAMYAVVVPRLTPWTVLTAAMACTLTIGTKYHVLPVSFLLCLALLIRLLQVRRSWSARTWWASGLAASGLIVLGLASVYVRNVYYFGNPIWPAALKIPGLVDLKSPYDMKAPFRSGKSLSSSAAFTHMLASPYSERAWNGPAARFEDYGVGGVFLTWPFALLSCVVFALRQVARKRRLGPRLQTALQRLGGAQAGFAVGVSVAVCLAMLATYPSIVRGRYYLPGWSACIVLAAWLTRHPSLRAVGRQLAFASAVLAVVSTVWAARAPMFPLPSQIMARLQVDQSERDYTARQLAGATKEFGAFRHKHFTPGTKVGFDAAFQLSQLWNDDFSNEVHWVRRPSEAERKGYDFLFLRTATFKKKRWDDSHWTYVTRPFVRYSNRPQGQLYRRAPKKTPKKTPKKAPKKAPKSASKEAPLQPKQRTAPPAKTPANQPTAAPTRPLLPHKVK